MSSSQNLLPLQWTELIDLLRGELVNITGPALEVKKITTDSRQVDADTLFIALKGSKTDSHQFIPQAIADGATVIVGEEPLNELTKQITYIQYKPGRGYPVTAMLAHALLGKPANKLQFLGVTGTNGKTTTAYLMHYLLTALQEEVTLLSTIETNINGIILPATHTTPDAITFHDLLQRSVKEQVNYVVMEVSSHAADQYRFHPIKFEALGFTNLTGDHLDYHGSMDAYFDAKKRPFLENLTSTGFAVINTDDGYGAKLARSVANIPVNFSDVISDFEHTATGCSFKLNGYPVDLPLFGRFNAANAATALFAVEHVTGTDLRYLIELIANFPGVPGRLEAVKLKTGAIGFVDYAHTDDALKNVCTTLQERPHNRLIVIFGCGGDRDRTKRPRMAQAAAESADLVIVTADNNRSESIEQIFADIEPGLPKSTQYEMIADRATAIARAVELSQPDDLILVAGKGHENYQIEQGQTRHFSDLEQLLKFKA